MKVRFYPHLLALALFATSLLHAVAEFVPLRISPLDAAGTQFTPTVEAPAPINLKLPSESGFTLHPENPANWVRMNAIRLSIDLADSAPTNLQMHLQVADWDGAWFQVLRRDFLTPGTTNNIEIATDAYAPGWEPIGHPGAWHRRSLLFPNMVRARLFANGSDYAGEIHVLEATGILADSLLPPTLHNIRPTEDSQAETPVDGRYELRFDIPDQYANPFDPTEIAVDAIIHTPSGSSLTVPCFYYQDCLREPSATEERILPQGRPEWRLRFSPNEEGLHTIDLRAVDRASGQMFINAASFTATPATGMRRIHVSKRDSRYFEDDSGKPFFLIGYNIRSPHDVRMDDNFPTLFRHPEGTTSYGRRFRQMHENGLNIAEIWASAWCMGLEWSALRFGYHGVGQYNMLNAWERDRVYAMAAENGIYINQVLNNHGRLSAFCDPEWQENPFNAGTQPGGWYHDPMQWFAEERARVEYEKQLRYEIARYSWNANLFAWELWSELDLAAKGGDNAHDHPVVHDWHRRMANYIKTHDPKHHLVSTHTSTDFTRMVPSLAAISELDHICGDAYHGSHDTLHICDLMHATKAQPHLLNRTALITEFGGTPDGAPINHLRSEVHAALWDALPSGLAGAPMFWWWHVVEEYDFFPTFAAFSRFIKDEDYLDPELRPNPQPVTFATPPTPTDALPNPPPIGVRIAQSQTRGYAWIHVMNDRYTHIDPVTAPINEGYHLRVPFIDNKAVYTFEFWDTLKGEPVRIQDARVRDGFADVPIPPFTRDIAVKFHLKMDSHE